MKFIFWQRSSPVWALVCENLTPYFPLSTNVERGTKRER
jgi:hypothetical protein